MADLPDQRPFNLPTDPEGYPTFPSFNQREEYIRNALRNDYENDMMERLSEEMTAEPGLQQRLNVLVDEWGEEDNFRAIEVRKYYMNKGDEDSSDEEPEIRIAREEASKAQAEQEQEERERWIKTMKEKRRAAHVPMPSLSGIYGRSIYYQPAADYQPERPIALDNPSANSHREPLRFPSRTNPSLERGDSHMELEFPSRIDPSLLFTSRWNPTLERRGGDINPDSSRGMRGGIGDTSESSLGVRGGIKNTSESSLGMLDTNVAEYLADAGGGRHAPRSPRRSRSPRDGVRSGSEPREMSHNTRWRGGEGAAWWTDSESSVDLSKRGRPQTATKTSRRRPPSPWTSGVSGSVCGSDSDSEDSAGSRPSRLRREEEVRISPSPEAEESSRFSRWVPSERSTLGRRLPTPPESDDSRSVDNSDSSTGSNAPEPRSQQEQEEFRKFAYDMLFMTELENRLPYLMASISIAFVGNMSVLPYRDGFKAHRGDLIISPINSRHIGLPNSVGYIASYLGEPYTFTTRRDLVLRVGNFDVEPPRGAFAGSISYQPFTYVELYRSKRPRDRMAPFWQFLGHQAELLDGMSCNSTDISPGKFLRVGTPVLGLSSDAVEALVPRRGDIIIKREVWVGGFDHATNFWYSMVKWHRGRRFRFFPGDMLVRRLVDRDRRGNWGWAELYKYEGNSLGWVFWGRTQHVYDSPWPERKKNVILYEYDHGTDSDDEIEKERANPKAQDSS